MWFQDEARVGQRGTITRLWAEKGTRPRVVRQLQYEYTYIFGAVCPQRDLAVGLVIDEVGTDAMLAHLKQISAQVGLGKTAILILDKAAWHTTKKLNVFSNIVLLPLPSASPELNSVEQLWQQLRDRFLANRCFKNQQELIDACCDAWNAYTCETGNIKSLCSREWAHLCN